MGSANGRNSRRYVRDNQALRATAPPYCSWCGEWIDRALPRTDPKSWTSDHTVALADGGDLYGERTPQHRACNSAKERARLEGRLTADGQQPIHTSEAW